MVILVCVWNIGKDLQFSDPNLSLVIEMSRGSSRPVPFNLWEIGLKTRPI
jgi:hypothetical protein